MYIVNDCRGDGGPGWFRLASSLCLMPLLLGLPKFMALPRAELPCHTVIWSVSFSPDGKYVAASEGVDSHVWDWQTGNEHLKLEYTYSAVWSPDGKQLAALVENKRIDFYDGQTLKKLQPRININPQHRGHAPLLYSPDGQFIIHRHQCHRIKVYEVANCGLVADLEGSLNNFAMQITTFAFAPDGKTLVAGTADGRLVFWDTKNWKIRTVSQTNVASISRVIYAPNGSHLALTGKKHPSVVFVDPRTGMQTASLDFPQMQQNMTDLAYDGTGERLVSLGYGGVTLWQAKYPDQLALLQSKYARLGSRNCVAISRDGRLVAFSESCGSRAKRDVVVVWYVP